MQSTTLDVVFYFSSFPLHMQRRTDCQDDAVVPLGLLDLDFGCACTLSFTSLFLPFITFPLLFSRTIELVVLTLFTNTKKYRRRRGGDRQFLVEDTPCPLPWLALAFIDHVFFCLLFRFFGWICCWYNWSADDPEPLILFLSLHIKRHRSFEK